MTDWYEQGGVRRDPRRLLRDDLDSGLPVFPVELVPHLHHEALRELPEPARRRLVLHHLYDYLTYTAHFETRVVNRAAEAIAHGAAGAGVPPQVRLEALQIYVDEGYHALYSLDVVDQVAAATGVPPLPYRFDGVLDRLDRVAAAALPGDERLAQLLQVVVFETSVTSILRDVPAAPELIDLVRTTVRDHARDEGRHHAFFARYFRLLWQALDPPARLRVARALPALIVHSLAGDSEPTLAALGAVGVPADTARAVVADTFSGPFAVLGIRAQAAQTLRLFESVGVLDVPGVADAFHEQGLLAADRRKPWSGECRNS